MGVPLPCLREYCGLDSSDGKWAASKGDGAGVESEHGQGWGHKQGPGSKGPCELLRESGARSKRPTAAQ